MQDFSLVGDDRIFGRSSRGEGLVVSVVCSPEVGGDSAEVVGGPLCQTDEGGAKRPCLRCEGLGGRGGKAVPDSRKFPET